MVCTFLRKEEESVEQLYRLKIIVKKILFCCILSISCFLISCNIGNSDTKYDSTIGIVHTSQQMYKSRIDWYNDELELLGSSKLTYAGLGSHFYKPLTVDNEVYMIPQGLGNNKST